jgi:drug/metabolite transporter (DMT)-like permease
MHAIPVYLILPLLLGLLYSIFAIAYKRTMVEGMDMWRIVFDSNLTTALLLLPLLVFADKIPADSAFYQPLLASLAFFAGIVMNILSLQRGDVSVVTPILGTKVLFVALFRILLLRETVRSLLWLAAVLVVISLTILRTPATNHQECFWPTVLLASGSSSAFAFCDVLFQHWAALWGIDLFIPAVFTGVCILSLMLPRWFAKRKASLSAAARRWLIAGCLVGSFLLMAAIVIAFKGYSFG